MKVKVVFKEEIRRWRFPKEENKDKFAHLQAFAEKAFGINTPRTAFHYQDEEGDHVVISGDRDLNEALDWAEDQKMASLKIYVAVKETKASSAPRTEKQAHKGKKKKKQEKKQQEEYTEQQEEEEDEECNYAKKKAKCAAVRRAVVELLQDTRVTAVLPLLVRRTLAALRTEVRADRHPSIGDVARHVLRDERFSPLTKHQLWPKIEDKLPCLLRRVERYQHLLLSFNEDAVAAWIPHLVKVLIQALSLPDACSGVGMDPLCHSLFPTWFAFMNAHGMFPTPGGNGEATHYNVECDACAVHPIRGPRFKCTVCPNYDLCARCESFGKHDPTHPMVKIYMPMRFRRPPYFAGLQEINSSWFRRFPCRRFQRGPPPRGATYGTPCQPSPNQPFVHKPKAEFVKDVNVPDRSRYPCGTVLTKCWEMRNGGDAPWGSDVRLVFIKGNECLTVERSYPVANAMPGEVVQVYATVRAPEREGRYCSYYRLETGGEKFGPRVWVDIFADEPPKVKQEVVPVAKPAAPKEQAPKQQEQEPQEAEEEEPSSIQQENEQKASQVDEPVSPKSEAKKSNVKPHRDGRGSWSISCTCGAPLIQTNPVAAYYPGASVNCDICGQYCPSSAFIYHCPAGKSVDHPEGYDLCANCVRFQMKAFANASPSPSKVSSSAPKKSPVPVKEAKPSPKPVKAAQPKKQEASKEQPAKVPKVPQQEAPPVQKKKKSPKQDEKRGSMYDMRLQQLRGFRFAREAIRVSDMGFDNIEAIKFLLQKYNGNVDRTVQDLIR